MADKAALVKEVLGINLRKLCNTFNLEYNLKIMDELERDRKFMEAINAKISRNNVFRTRVFESIYQFSIYRNLLYYLVRLINPKVVVETGVLHGLTSAWILKAIAKNGTGKLISIDLPRRDWDKFFPSLSFGPGGESDLELPKEEMPGWIIPDDLRIFWEFLFGPSSQHLDKVCQNNKLDLFVHDSDHSYDIMKYECTSVLEKHPDVFMVIDDFNQNEFCYEYLSKNKARHIFIDEVDDNCQLVTCTAVVKATRKESCSDNSDKGLNLMYNQASNRKWQNHLKSKGFDAFIYDRLMMFSLSNPKSSSAFNFKVEKDEDNSLAKYWYNWMEEFPYQIYIEVTNNCNLNCSMCARQKMTRPKGVMSYELFKKIIDEVAQIRPVSYLHIYGIGDPQMDPGILKKVEYSCGIKQLHNQLFGTNGSLLLKNDMYKKLVDLNISEISIDLDGFSKNSYEKIRVGGDFEGIIKTIQVVSTYICQVASKTRLNLIYQVIPEVNEHEVESFITWCEKNGYEYKLVNLHSWAGLRKEYLKNAAISRTSPCRGQWDGMMVYWNGDVGTCFQDANGYQIFGNVEKQSIREIWQGSLRKRRKEQVHKIFKGLCQGCQSFIKSEIPSFKSPIYPEILRS